VRWGFCEGQHAEGNTTSKDQKGGEGDNSLKKAGKGVFFGVAKKGKPRGFKKEGAYSGGEWRVVEET